MNNSFRSIRGIVIDPGHGGDDPGAVGNGLLEKDLNLEVALYLYNRFNELGIPVKLTRSTDETLNSTERVRRILNAFGNNSDVIVLSNHINAGGGDGAETIYALRNSDTLAKSILEAIGRQGQNMRKYYQRRLPSDPSKDYYFIHRETGKTQPVIIEYGFIDSPNDDVSQLKNNLLDYGEAVVQAVAEYTNTPYIPPEGKNTYVVKKGDSLWSIANKYGITVDELTSANNLTSNLLNVGQILNIPIKETPPTPSDYLIYTVKKGDSLWSIANQYNVDIDDIINTNNLGTTLLQVNQQLLIPNNNNNVTSKTYTVKAGDSLWSIANKYNITVNELKTLNNLTTNTLSIGQQLLIPTTNNNQNETPDNPNDITYVVQSGDSLWSIAKKYNINVNDLKTYNNLNSNLLSIGQQLLIPKTQNYTTYIVQSGDSLWKIANKYDVTVDEIISLNNLNNTILSIGQVLLIPA